jgi:hypothetical protein
MFLFSMSLTKFSALKRYREYFRVVLTSTLHRILHLKSFVSGDRAVITHWVIPRAGLVRSGQCERETDLLPLAGTNHICQAYCSYLGLYTDLSKLQFYEECRLLGCYGILHGLCRENLKSYYIFMFIIIFVVIKSQLILYSFNVIMYK